MEKDGDVITKVDAEAKVAKAHADLDQVEFKLKTAEAKLAQAEEKATWSEDQ